MASLIFFVFSSFLCSVSCNEKNWWKTAAVYEVYIRSFKDSNGDGIGDLKGITSKLNHFKDLQIEAIWLTPFYESPQVDMGYDISNYKNVDPMFGTLTDFEELTQGAAERGIKVLIDFVMNHSSDEHPWFTKSVEKIEPYDDYYVWKDAKYYDQNNNPIPPNNWLSVFGGSAWEWNKKRQQFYLHHFHKKQVDFNLRNENVKREFKEILNFWFDKGVSGVRMDAVPFYIEHIDFPDEPLLNPKIKKDTLNRRDLATLYSTNQKENFELLREFRIFLEEVSRDKEGFEKIMVVEAVGDFSDVLKYYGTKERPIAHYPFDFDFLSAQAYYTAVDLHESITKWLKNLPEHGVVSWVAENHDFGRIGSKFVREYTNIMNFLVMMLPGVPCIYYGQEIGMTNGLVRPDQHQEKDIVPGVLFSRDFVRTPMQWDNSINAGFTSKTKPWLPVNPNYWLINLEAQKLNKSSFYHTFKDLSFLRKTKTCKHGKLNSYVLSTWVYAFTRILTGFNPFVVVFNLGTEIEMVNLYSQIPNLPIFLKVLVASENAGYTKGDIVKIKSFPHIFVMKPLSAIVLSTVTFREDSLLDDTNL